MQRRRIRVTGTVQGVGFRPHVRRLATRLGLAGHVCNDAHGVLVEVEGHADAVATFERALAAEAPPLAVVEDVSGRDVPVTGGAGFSIVASDGGGPRTTHVPPDVASCAACLSEVADPDDRRHRYALTNCTDCGPRYSIVRGVPYDRPLTTMAGFPLCPDCEVEYRDPDDRRYHAQPVCCPACGPRLRVEALADGVETRGDPLDAAARLLLDGFVVAVKGVGGFHLAVVASDQAAVATLRARKHREDKPFAVLVDDLDRARALAHLAADEAALLADPARPIVLLRRRADAPLASAVAPDTAEVGLLLAYTPLHHLLLAAVDAPLVLTSGNVSDEPLVHRDQDAPTLLAPVADALLTHDRPIHVRVDDSVARVVDGAPVVLRRARGYVPRPLRLPVAPAAPVLAVGAELKSTVCVTRGDEAVLSQHLGDLRSWEVLQAFHQAVDHLTRLLDVGPRLVAHDLHPEYLSTKHAHELADVTLVGVQHHHAHVAACLAEHGRGDDEQVLGIALDGTGWGPDGTIWGGELLLADLRGARRVGHLGTVALPGGDAAVREPWRMAVAHLLAAHDDLPDVLPRDLPVLARNTDRVDAVATVARSGLAPRTSSAGRLFDAVAALLDVRDVVTHEGQAAIGLEQLARGAPAGAGALAPRLDGPADGPLVLDPGTLVAQVVEQYRAGVDRAVVAARFHAGLAAGLVAAATRLCGAHGLGTAVLSGGVFQNVLLLRAVRTGLEDAGLEVLAHRRVPPNDGGIALGQAAVAAARHPAG